MRRRSGDAICAVLLSVCAVAREGLAQSDDPALRAQFLKGVADVAKSLEGVSLRARCTLRSKLIEISEETRRAYAKTETDPYVEDVSEFECAVLGTCCVLQRRKEKNGLERTEVKNPKYAFALSRAANAQSFALQFLEKVDANSSVAATMAEAERTVRSMAWGGHCVFGVPLSIALRETDFRLKQVHSVAAEDGKALVRAEFDYVVGNRPQLGFDTHYTDGYLICDPANSWMIMEFGATWRLDINKTTGQHRFTVKDYVSHQGVPLATKTEHLVIYSGGTIRRTVRTLELLASDDVPEEEFYLSHYGLPEPNFSRSWASPWVWYLVGGIACLAIGAIILKRRKTRT